MSSSEPSELAGASQSTTEALSTGSPDLNGLIEELRAGDNVVFYTPSQREYLPFVRALLRQASAERRAWVYVRSSGSFDSLIGHFSDGAVWDLSNLASDQLAESALRSAIERTAPGTCLVFEALDTYTRWFPDETRLCQLFLTLCPLLFRAQAVAYWDILRDSFSTATMAAIKDCTQILLKVQGSEPDLVLIPLKVWGRFSETMFWPHRVITDGGILRVAPSPASDCDAESYAQALAEKNRELAEIRDALDQSNHALVQRNNALADLNRRLSEQSRLYESLRDNLDRLLNLLQVEHTIGSTLALDQVRQASLEAAQTLFGGEAGRLRLAGLGDIEAADMVRADRAEQRLWMQQESVVALRHRVEAELSSQAITLDDESQTFSAIIAPLTVRGRCLGTIEVYAEGRRLDDDGLRTLLGYLASQTSIALDNALLYREVETQGQQLRSFVDGVISDEEQASRRLALDLHDGLVQIIVAAYQHLQSAEAWRSNDPETGEREFGHGVQLLRQAIGEARRLIAQLRPTALDDLGLVHALRLYVVQISAEMDWEVTLDVAPAWQPLPVALEAAIFRMVQEATTNARKYAEASRVAIKLDIEDDRLLIRIRDWGKGFDPAAVQALPQQGLHMGLIGIRERARLWGGKCDIFSHPGKGTTIEVSIPGARALAARKETDSD